MAWVSLPSMLIVALLLWPALTSAQGNSRNIYCCENAEGRSICGDVLPLACYGRAYREISPRGSVVRSVAAPLTAAEAARLEAENRIRERKEAEQRQQRRFDSALLETYRSLEDIDTREARAVEDVDTTIVDIRKRQTELEAERAMLERRIAEAGAEVPPSLRHARRAVDAEHASYVRILEAKRSEKRAVLERYATDRRRYAELMAAREMSPE